MPAYLILCLQASLHPGRAAEISYNIIIPVIVVLTGIAQKAENSQQSKPGFRSESMFSVQVIISVFEAI